ncbi:MAG: hypothetical protein IT381_11215 [Deltaproteobacteria bacterium]|nr:hypothetical protein [Deltaproteobacteria bacterium]
MTSSRAPLPKRALSIFALYLSVVLTAATVLTRTIAKNAAGAEQPVAVRADRAGLSCVALAAKLEDELFTWYVAAVRELSADSMRPEPTPGLLREWESARAAGAERCQSDASATKKFSHLLNVRRGLESNTFLLATRIGEDVSGLH